LISSISEIPRIRARKLNGACGGQALVRFPFPKETQQGRRETNVNLPLYLPFLKRLKKA
jgi:hypothetical protein